MKFPTIPILSFSNSTVSPFLFHPDAPCVRNSRSRDTSFVPVPRILPAERVTKLPLALIATVRQLSTFVLFFELGNIVPRVDFARLLETRLSPNLTFNVTHAVNNLKISLRANLDSFDTANFANLPPDGAEKLAFSQVL